MSDQQINSYGQLLNSVLPYSYDVNPFANGNGLTINTISAASDSANVTISGESTSNGVWSGQLTAASVGRAVITLTTTFTSSGVIRKRKFQVDVTDF